MEKEHKELLLRDLCARLPYGVIVEDRNGTHTLTTGDTEFASLFGGSGLHNIKPYLRPMSSRTESEKDKCWELSYLRGGYDLADMAKVYDYLNSIHVDYRGLIEKGLALEAPEGMYNEKKK